MQTMPTQIREKLEKLETASLDSIAKRRKADETLAKILSLAEEMQRTTADFEEEKGDAESAEETAELARKEMMDFFRTWEG
jgi:hypothetical protein